MKELEVIGKEIEIYKVKLLLFIAVAGGSWVYAFKLDMLIFTSLLWFVFLVMVIGIFLNISKLSSLQKELKGFKHG